MELMPCYVDHSRGQPCSQAALWEPSTVDRCARPGGGGWGEERYRWVGWKHWCSASCRA
jgi:hypothetical protein